MQGSTSIVERPPTADEYLDLIAAVGWRPRDRAAVETALAHTLFAVVAEQDGRAIGCGRVIGDGGLHLYLTDVVVVPEHQRRGVGTTIVTALTRYVEAVPYVNVLAAVLPNPGQAGFYARHGYRSQGVSSPVMHRWINGKTR